MFKPEDTSNGPAGGKIPAGISDYIRQHFVKEFLSEIRPVKSRDGKVMYDVDVSKDNTLYHLKFNAAGVLTGSEAEPLFELLDDEGDDHE